MSRRTHQDVIHKLFQISIRPKKWHDNSIIVLPESISAIKNHKIFRSVDHKRILELGAGWGEFAASFLHQNLDWDYTAFEIKPDRIQSIIKKTGRVEGAHIRIIPVNLNWFLEDILPENAWDLIVINFPDPWPKKRHYKHRLIQPGFAKRIRTLLKAKGKLWVTTDYGPYARRILREFRDSECFQSDFLEYDYTRVRPDEFFETRFERIQMRQGKRPYYMKWLAV